MQLSIFFSLCADYFILPINVSAPVILGGLKIDITRHGNKAQDCYDGRCWNENETAIDGCGGTDQNHF